MRNIIEVCNELTEMFEDPATKQDIDHVIKSVEYTAPELMYMRWNQLQEAVFDNIPEDEKQWSEKHIRIVSKFSTVSVEEIKADIERR